MSTCDVFKVLSFSTKWNTAAIKSLLLFMASLFIGFLVERCVACQSQKSDFGWDGFHFSSCLMQKRVQKSQVILALLDSFQELHLEWYKAWVIIVFDICFFTSIFMKSSTVYAASLCTFVRFETMIWPTILHKSPWDSIAIFIFFCHFLVPS